MRRRHTRSLCDWISDVCSSDLEGTGLEFLPGVPPFRERQLRHQALLLLAKRRYPGQEFEPRSFVVGEHARELDQLFAAREIARASCRERCHENEMGGTCNDTAE